MPKVEYSSDEDTSSRRAWLGDSRGSSSGSRTQGRGRKTAGKAKAEMSNKSCESQNFVGQHKSQVLAVAAVAGGLAIAGIVFNKMLGSKSNDASKADRPAQPKKLAARRKRSGTLHAPSSAATSPKHKHPRHEQAAESAVATGSATAAAAAAASKPVAVSRTLRSKTSTIRGPAGKRPALPAKGRAPSGALDSQIATAGRLQAADRAGSSSSPQEESDTQSQGSPPPRSRLAAPRPPSGSLSPQKRREAPASEAPKPQASKSESHQSEPHQSESYQSETARPNVAEPATARQEAPISQQSQSEAATAAEQESEELDSKASSDSDEQGAESTQGDDRADAESASAAREEREESAKVKTAEETKFLAQQEQPEADESLGDREEVSSASGVDAADSPSVSGMQHLPSLPVRRERGGPSSSSHAAPEQSQSKMPRKAAESQSQEAEQSSSEAQMAADSESEKPQLQQSRSEVSTSAESQSHQVSSKTAESSSGDTEQSSSKVPQTADSDSEKPQPQQSRSKASTSAESQSQQPKQKPEAGKSQGVAESKSASRVSKAEASGPSSSPEFGQSIQEGPNPEETRNSQISESAASPTSSSNTGAGKQGQEEEQAQEAEEEKERDAGPVAPKAEEGGSEEGAPPKPATGQEEEGPEAAERAEEEVKAAADAINKQLPKEAQGGSLQPLVEEKEEGEAQPLDTFSSEIDSFDMSKRQQSQGGSDEEQEKGAQGGRSKAQEKSDKDGKKKSAAAQQSEAGTQGESAEGEEGAKKKDVVGSSEGSEGQEEGASADSDRSKEQGKEQSKAASGKGGKEAVMHPAQPVPVRLESESLDSGKGTSKGKQEGTKGRQGSAKEGAAAAEGESQEEGQKPLEAGQGKGIQQKQPDLATVAEDASAEPQDPSSAPPLQRAPSPSASLSSEDATSTKKSDAAAPAHASAFGARAQRAFSDHSEDLSELGGSSSKSLDKKPSSSSAYSGLNPTSTRSASRMLSDNPPPPTRKPSGPISRRDLVANSILQLDIDNELDTFTADIDCLVDSSDEEEQQQLGGKDRSEPEGKGDSESAGKAESSSKREKKSNEQEDDDEGDGDDDAANVEDLGSGEHHKMDSFEEEEAAETSAKSKKNKSSKQAGEAEEEGGSSKASDSAQDKQGEEERSSSRASASNKDAGSEGDEEADLAKDKKKKKGKSEGEAEEEGSDKPSTSKKDDDDDEGGRPESGSGGGAVASGAGSAQSSGKKKGQSSGGSKGKQSKKKGGAGKGGKKRSASHAEDHAVPESSSASQKARDVESATPEASAPDAAHSAESASESKARSHSKAASQPASASGSNESSPDSAPAAKSHAAHQSGSAAESRSDKVESEPAQASRAKSEAADRPAAIQHPAMLSGLKDQSCSDSAPDADSMPAQHTAAAAAADHSKASSSQSMLSPTNAENIQPICTSVHPDAAELTRSLDAQFHPELARVASDMTSSSPHTVMAAPALAQAADEFNREADSVEAPQPGMGGLLGVLGGGPSHAFGMGDLTQFKDSSLAKDMEEPLRAEDLPPMCKSRKASAQLDRSKDSAHSGQAKQDSAPLGQAKQNSAHSRQAKQDSAQSSKSAESDPAEIDAPADLDGLLGDTVENIGIDPRYADVLTKDGDTKDVDSRHNTKAASTASSNQESADGADPSTPNLAHPRAHPLSDSESSGSGRDPSPPGQAAVDAEQTNPTSSPEEKAGGATDEAKGATEGDEDDEEMIIVDIEYIHAHQDALKTAPLLGDSQKLKANEEFTPSTKEEKGAASLHTQAIHLFNDAKTKQQGERLQRQVLQYLIKEKANPAMISTVAANLIDMLWEQNKVGEAAVVMDQARGVAKQAGRSLEFQKLSHNLAVLQRKKLGDIETAYEIYQEGLLDAMPNFGQASNYTLVARSHLVEVLVELSQPATAEVLLQDAADDLVETTHLLQQRYFALADESEEAGKLKEQSNQATMVAARTLSELGKVRHLMGNNAEAEECFCQSLQLAEAVTGPGHADAMTSLGAYAAFLKEKEDPESRLRAVEMYKTVQLSVQEKEGFNNDQNAIVLRIIADCLEAVEQYAEAAGYAEQAVKAIQGALGQDHPALESFWDAVANLHEKAGQQGAAKKARSQAQKVKKAHRKAKLAAGDKRVPVHQQRTGLSY